VACPASAVAAKVAAIIFFKYIDDDVYYIANITLLQKDV
jgi:hypothetical protein